MKRKIILLIKSLGIGGAERHVFQLAKAFKKRGDDVLVVYLDRRDNVFDQRLGEQGIDVFCLDFQDSKIRSLYNLIILIRDFAPDVVHSHLPIPNFFARIGKFFIRYRLVSTYHNELGRLHKFSRFAECLSFWISDCNVACSADVANSLPWSSRIIDNGIDFSSYNVTERQFVRSELQIDKSSKIFLNVSNFWAKKNQSLLIRAFSDFLRKSNANAHLVILGVSGNLKNSLRDLCRELELEDRVHFLLPQDNVANVFSDADVFCMTSDYEGLPLALLEAMSFSLPCIVTDAGAMGRAVLNNFNGFVCSKGDLNCISEAMNMIFQDNELRTRMGERGLERAQQHYSAERMLNQIEKVYETL